MQLDKQLIKERSETLEQAKVYLKTQFIGIDSIIDKFINSVKVWYILPEIQTRPLLVNLWGITGTGKTDLIRKFVSFLNFTDKFCEIQMDSKEGSATIEDYLDNTFDNQDTQGILLLDEFQRFRTITEEGKENNSNKFQDLWMLLSDGTFQSNSKIKQELNRIILEEDFNDERYSHRELTSKEEIDSDAKEKERREKWIYKMAHWEASRLKKLLKLPQDLSEVMKMTKDDKLKLLKEKINSKETYEGKKYSRLLIVISGNLDEAFKMAAAVSDADVDADVYHDFSKTIDIIKIKLALKHRFKPEQIARLGNIHLIYPLFNKDTYNKIIIQKVNGILTEVREKHNIDIKIDNSVYTVIYQNGVFPAQGVRPLLSTISAIVENSLPIFIFEYLQSENTTGFKLMYKGDNLYSRIGDKKVAYKIPRVLEDIKKRQTANHKSLIAVHEAGHAIVYAVLNKTAPTQIVATTTSDSAGGFVGVHGDLGSKQDIINDIKVSLAGRAAEEIVFGKNCITAGAASDFLIATTRMNFMFKKYGMQSFLGVYSQPNRMQKGDDLDSTEEMDAKVESELQEIYTETLELVEENKALLLNISTHLFNKQKLEPDEFVALVEPFIGKISVISAQDKIETCFHEKFKNVLKENNSTATVELVDIINKNKK